MGVTRFSYMDKTFYQLELDQAESRKGWERIINSKVAVTNQKPHRPQKDKYCSLWHANLDSEQFCEECGEDISQ